MSAVGTTVLAIALHLYAARGATAPRTSRDEVTLLQIARLLAGGDDLPALQGQGYYPGWSVVMTPLWWFTSDPAVIYQSAIGLGIAFAALTIWPTTLLVRKLGLALWPAWTVAALAMCTASRTVQAAYVLSEILLLFLIAWTALAAWRLTERPTPTRAVVLAASASACLLTHPRALVVLVVCALWFLVLARRALPSSLAGLASLTVGYLLVTSIVDAINDRVLRDGFTQVDNLSSALQSTSPTLMVGSVTGHTWAQLFASLGLVSVGALILAGRGFAAIRVRKPAPELFIVILAGAGTAASMATWSGANFLVDSGRLDVWLYGRYADPYTHLLLLVGIGGLLVRAPRWVWWVQAVLVGLVVALAALVVAPRAPLEGYFGPSQAAGLQPLKYFTNPTILPSHPDAFWLIGSGVIIIGLLLPLVARWPGMIVAVLAVVLTTASIVSKPDQTRGAPQATLDRVEDVEDATRVTDLAIEVDRNCLKSQNYLPINWLAYWMSPREVSVVSDAGPASDSLVVSCPPDSSPGAGAIPLLPSGDNGMGLWLPAGPIQDQFVEVSPQ